MKQGSKGVILGGTVLVASYGYALHLAAEEPEFGPIVGLGLAVLGTAAAVPIIVISVVEGAKEERKATARKFKMRLNPPRTGEHPGEGQPVVSPRVPSNSPDAGKSN